MMPDPAAVVVSVTWRPARAGERQRGGLVMVSYANGAISSRPSTRAAAEKLAVHHFGPDAASHPFQTETGVRWRPAARPPDNP